MRIAHAVAMVGPVIGTCGTLALAGAAALWRGVHATSSQLLAPSVSRVPGAGNRIALTFDDGPSESTPELLELLQQHCVRATFFLCGANVERLPNVARAIVAAGHEIGNHTQTHMRLCPRIGWKLNLHSPADLLREIAKAQQSIDRHTGVLPRLFRAPYGLRWIGLRAAQRKLCLHGVMWSVMGHDWEWPRERIADHLLKNTEPGGIVCLHDGRDIRPKPDLTEMLAALRSVLPVWHEQGYAVGTVGSLLLAEDRRKHIAEEMRRLSAT